MKSLFNLPLSAMKALTVAVLMSLFLSGCGNVQDSRATPEPWCQPVNDDGDPVFAVFESRIPCADCERIKLALALYRDSETEAPTTYKLARVYVGKSPEDRIVVDGAWTITQGTKLDPNAIVYQLDADAPLEFRSFWAIGQDIVFVLDQNRSPRVGTASYSFALNRMRE
jgi:hypothetical protein